MIQLKRSVTTNITNITNTTITTTTTTTTTTTAAAAAAISHLRGKRLVIGGGIVLQRLRLHRIAPGMAFSEKSSRAL